MHTVTNADREAAEELRLLLADISGFWHKHGDAGPICLALARHRELAERRLRETMAAEAPRSSVIPLVVPDRDTRTVRERRHRPLATLTDPRTAAAS